MDVHILTVVAILADGAHGRLSSCGAEGRGEWSVCMGGFFAVREGIGRRFLLAVGMGAMLVLAGCDNDRVAGTEEDVTTESEVLARWGKPANIWDGPDGARAFEYNRQPQGTTNYMITIGQDGKVTALRQVLTRENFARVQPGMPMEDVRKLLGQPARVTPYPLQHQTVYTWRFREGHGAASLFTATFDADLAVVSTAIGEDPQDMSSTAGKP